MKKLLIYACIVLLIIQSSACATIVGGEVTSYQRTRPAQGHPSRAVKVVPLVCDIFFFGGLGVIVDFATGAIYKPAHQGNGLFDQP